MPGRCALSADLDRLLLIPLLMRIFVGFWAASRAHLVTEQVFVMGFGDERKRISRGDVRNLGLSGLSNYVFSFRVNKFPLSGIPDHRAEVTTSSRNDKKVPDEVAVGETLRQVKDNACRVSKPSRQKPQ
jgi:hypothetical protein